RRTTASRSTPSSSSARAGPRRSPRSSISTAGRRARWWSAGPTGGSMRQQRSGGHDSDSSSNAYAMNQSLASRGFVVLAINYRLGIGYGYEFHRPRSAGAQGASEYKDVKAA